MTGDEKAPPRRLKALVDARVPTLSAEQRRDGWRRLRSRMDGSPRRARWAVLLAFAGGAAAAAVVLVPRRPAPVTTGAFEVRGATVRGDEIFAEDRAAEVRFRGGGTVALRQGATMRVTTQPRGRVLSVDGQAVVTPPPEARWTVQAGPFRVAVTAGPIEIDWSADDARFAAHVERGAATISGPLAGRALLVRTGDRVTANLRAYGLRVDGATATRAPSDRRPEIAAAALSATEPSVTVAWDRPTGATATGLHYGLNLNRAFDPGSSARSDAVLYQNNLSAMRPGLVRLYRDDIVEDAERKRAGWMLEPDRPTYRWSADKIRRALENAIPPGAVTMLTIPRWPAFMGDPKQPLRAEHHDAFAALCAELVRIVNVQLGHGVRYFEILNELDDVYRGRGDELGALFVRIARAMKAVDPTIRVGGPAFVQAWHPVIAPFLRHAGPALDFVSYHGYGTGDRPVPLADVLDAASGFGHIASYIDGMVTKHVGRRVEIFHDQYNLTWKAPDDRMTGAVSAVFDALALASMAQSPLTGAAAWCEADGWYGKLDARAQARPAAHVFRLYNANLVGPVVEAEVTGGGAVVPFAVAGSAGRALSLVNRSETQQRVRLTLGDGPWHVHRVTAAGASDEPLPTADALVLPPLSVTVLVSPRADK